MTMPQPVFSSEARVATAASARYLGQLCKHFQHRLPVACEGAHGRIDFSSGTCTLEAATDADTLILRVETGDETALPGLEDVVARHLERFAFRDKPAIVWSRTAS